MGGRFRYGGVKTGHQQFIRSQQQMLAFMMRRDGRLRSAGGCVGRGVRGRFSMPAVGVVIGMTCASMATAPVGLFMMQA